MRLSGLKLAGFKSFVDPTQLPLPSNLTSIVGPNGCGKSNIIDAVRWVLGEASQKQLRTQDSEDVIFTGSKTRKPVGRAAVELHFDNSDGQIQGPYAAYTDIAIRRELTRDGNSQYFLNGRKCLKRDVTDLLLGTGLGGRNQYAIIEQGMVSRMIEAKPEELRAWLEEAAGISKYKERRKETESRIRSTRENLARLNDLRTELQARLEVLRKQAANAEKYKNFKQEERTLKAEILALRERGLEADAHAHEARIVELEQALEEVRAAVTAAETGRETAEADRRAAQEALNDEQTKVYEAESAASRLEQDLQHARELRSMKQRELEQLERALADLDRRRVSDQNRLEQALREVEELERNVERSQLHHGEAQANVERSEQSLTDEQHRWDDFQSRSETPLFETEGERVRVQALERAQFQIEERFKRLSAESAGLDAGPIQTSLFDADAELARLDTDLADSQERLESLDRDLGTLRERRSALDGGLHESRQQLQAARGRLSSLETLQQAALGQDDADLANWLRQEDLGAAPRLAQRLHVQEGWEACVEHVLEGLLQAPLVEGAAGRSAGGWPKSGAVLLDTRTDEGSLAPAGTLAEMVHGPSAVRDFLGSVHACRSPEEAASKLSALGPGESVITPDGIWRGRDWLRAPRTDEARSGVLAREHLIQQLKGQVEELASAIRAREAELMDLRTQQQQAETERREQSLRFEQSRSRHAQRLAFRQAQAVRLEQTQARIADLVRDIEALKAQRESQAAELTASREKLTSLEQIAQELKNERVARQQDLARARDAVTRNRALLQQAAQTENQVQIQLASRKSQVAAFNQSAFDLEAQREQLVLDRDRRIEEGGALDAPLAARQAQAESARAAVNAQREALRESRLAVENAERVVSTVMHRFRELEMDKDAAQERLQAARIEFENTRARRESYAQQLADACREGGFEREAVFAGLPEDATAEAWDEKIAALGRRIERLGAINLAAIQELEEAEGREKYLGEQYADLTGALDTLEDAIRKIDAETKERFKDTFERVDAIFRDRFPKLFGGGEAYLELTGEDLLDTGVRVMARPPGKRNSSIQMLSGGEKAMTAVALLLGLFQLNPAPFCLMDEVDAPLDDANVARFCEVVREMSQNVQFIIITHNKITMELAEQLHGVTMQEPGVSRLVSVDVAQAVELAGKPESKE
ncbi:MAG TPA: chromosome segregation protein SMC [Nevskiaceae bacterium]|nr:chromosome segregation protein SMC [Nevskiaceae bacterium]